MVRFIIHRPIAVTMAFLMLTVLGIIAYRTLPVSLLPDIPIPVMTVRIEAPGRTAREMEENMVTHLRQALLHVQHVEDVRSEAYNEYAVIRLYFKYGTSTDLAFIEVNERVDATMHLFPHDVARPRVIRLSASDIPVLYLNLSLKDQKPFAEPDIPSFLAMCDIAEMIVKRRIEQLPEVTMADMTGMMDRYVRIVPDGMKMESAGVTLPELEAAIARHNMDVGAMTVRNGQFEYQVRFAGTLRNASDLEHIFFRKGTRIYALTDFCDVQVMPDEAFGYALAMGKQAVTLAVIKHPDARMADLRTAVEATVSRFRRQYPEIDFILHRNQTEWLDHTIGSLKQNFGMGCALILVVMIVFLGEMKSPVVTGVCMTVSLSISMLFFFLFHKSLNIISISGLIMALGMMMDHAVIMTENICQYAERGMRLREACICGTSEIILPVLSSTLTTVAVFVPLVFLSGIAGALFTDEAFAITVGLIVSYFTGILLLPVLYSLTLSWTVIRQGAGAFLLKIRQRLDQGLYAAYEVLDKLCFTYQKTILAMMLLAIPACILLVRYAPKSIMPALEQPESMIRIAWNEPISVEENRRRIDTLCSYLAPRVTDYAAYIGRQRFILNEDADLFPNESKLYMKVSDPQDINRMVKEVRRWLDTHYPRSSMTDAPPESVFENTFSRNRPAVVAELHPRPDAPEPASETFRQVLSRLEDWVGEEVDDPADDPELTLVVDQEKLLLYDVTADEINRTLRVALQQIQVTVLRSFQQYLPVTIRGQRRNIEEMLRTTLIQTRHAGNDGRSVLLPLRAFVMPCRATAPKSISAGMHGEYVPVAFHHVGSPSRLMEQISTFFQTERRWDVSFSGSFTDAGLLSRELVVVLLVSLLLMYFILVSQFESFVQPLLVLLEIPMDMTLTLLCLRACGYSLNLMSGIGLIMSCGIVVNDSILKLDMVNALRKSGMPLRQALATAGHRRMRPILMTSITTVLAVLPLLFTSDFGSRLQAPLAVTMIASMVVGTFISMHVIPLGYMMLYRNKEKSQL